VDEIACLLDFGVDTQRVMDSLPRLNEVRKTLHDAVVEGDPTPAADLSFAGLVREHAVSHMQCTPSTVRMLMTDSDASTGVAAIEHILLGGEALPESLAEELIALSPGTLTNMYGPTETTIWSTTSSVSSGTAVNIGTPIANTRVYVLDKLLSPVPAGMPGELFIGGDGVARGYFDRPELTAERFLPDPFAGGEARMYATGDLVRWHENGYLQYLGRTDFQVKVRGYRIELGEIEKQMEQLSAVQEAAVIVRAEDETDQRLVAFVVPAPDVSVDAQAIRSALKESLPDYMIPNEVIEIEAMPQTANAKLDRKALQALKPKPPVAAVASVSAESDLEKQIADFWCQTLKLDRVGVEDNFFDLGGHSLLVVQLHKKIRESVDQPVSLTDLYQFPTVRSLAQHMEGGSASSSPTKGAQRGERRRAMRRRGAR
jgi:acyl-CoA synthetase (AMP-forming)/AMP-acid ligase II/acyl carrier protein